MASVVVHDPLDATVAGRVTLYDPSAHTPDYDSEVNKLVNPDLSAVSGEPTWLYWKVVSGSVAEMTQSEKDLLTPPEVYDLEPADPVIVGGTADSPQLPKLDGSLLTGIQKYSAHIVLGSEYYAGFAPWLEEWQHMRTFSFPGTDVLQQTAWPDKATTLIRMWGSHSGTIDIQIWDDTSECVVAEKLGINVSDTGIAQIYDLGPILYLPPAPAVWQLYCKQTNKQDDHWVYDVKIYKE